MKKILLCIFILSVSVNVFASDVNIYQLTATANQGDAKAQYELGICYIKGTGVNQNNKQAVYWLQKAAGQGNVNAQILLGTLYHAGYAVGQDENQSIYWLKKAAEQGSSKAQLFLGVHSYDCDMGMGAQDYKLSYMWASISSEDLLEAEFKSMRKGLFEDLKQKMTSSEIAEAQQIVAQWMERHK